MENHWKKYVSIYLGKTDTLRFIQAKLHLATTDSGEKDRMIRILEKDIAQLKECASTSTPHANPQQERLHQEQIEILRTGQVFSPNSTLSAIHISCPFEINHSNMEFTFRRILRRKQGP